MGGRIHATAIIAPEAELADDVEVGPYSIVGPHVRIGAGTIVGAHCIIDGDTTIGENNNFYRFCSIGGMPQDKKYRGEPTRLEIGNGNTLREYVTVNTGTVQDVGVTRLGDDNWIMAYAHVAHDCQVGSHTVLANGVQLAGHVWVGDWVILGGLSAVHQFVHIGPHCMVGGTSTIRHDLPPYVIGAGDPFRPVGINSEGLQRRGFDADTIAALKEAYKLVYRRNLTVEEAAKAMRRLQDEQPEARDAIEVLASFIERPGRGFAR